LSAAYVLVIMLPVLVGRDDPSDLLVEPIEDLDGELFLLESTAEHTVPDLPIEHTNEPAHPGDETPLPTRERMADVIDGLSRTLVPPLGVPHREDDLRSGSQQGSQRTVLAADQSGSDKNVRIVRPLFDNLVSAMRERDA
jgi:hypothetical protein